jgi:hypothetical protein
MHAAYELADAAYALADAAEQASFRGEDVRRRRCYERQKAKV